MTDVQNVGVVKQFRRRINFLSGTMIFFACLMNILFFVYGEICELAFPLLTDIGDEIFSSVTYGLTYLASFLVPALILHASLKEDIYPKGYKVKQTSKGAVLWLFLTLGSIYCCALLNNYLMNLFFGIIGQPSMELFESSFNGLHSILLEIFTTAMVPGLCEEVLFRGVFLKKLLPFGKNTAVVISALFFALMHQMPLQFFYTFCAGLMLGYLFLKTGSIWWGVLVHTLNNLLSVITSVFDHYLDERTATVCGMLLYVILAIAAMVSLFVLIRKGKGADRLRESVFGKTERLPAIDGENTVCGSTAIRNFFTPVTVVFLAIYLLLTVVNFAALYMV